MTTIDDVSTNNMNFKHLDTTKDIVITPKDEFGNLVQLNASHTWTAKVSDETNYVGDYQVTLESTSIVVNSSDFTNLPAGHYHLEVWEEWTDSNGKKQCSIYPSPRRTIDFTIYHNVSDLAEKEIKTIGFQDVVDQAVMNIGMNYVFKVNTIEPDQTATVVQAAADGKNYVTFNIPRGAKGDPGKPFSIAKVFPSKDTMNGDGLSEGDFVIIASDVNDPNNATLFTWTGNEFKEIADLSGAQGIQGPQGPKGATGTVDNTGLTTAPAFVNLQTQVNNSAVGTNLLTGTSSDLKTMQLTNEWNVNSQATNGNYKIKVIKGQTYTYRVWLDNTNGSGQAFANVRFVAIGATADRNLGIGGTIDKGETGYSTFVFTPTEDGYVKLIPFAYGEPKTALVGWKEEKLENGSVATDWCPNPAEILTQADYAKIQAAIVALGGSLK